MCAAVSCMPFARADWTGMVPEVPAYSGRLDLQFACVLLSHSII